MDTNDPRLFPARRERSVVRYFTEESGSGTFLREYLNGPFEGDIPFRAKLGQAPAPSAPEPVPISLL